MAAVGSDIRIAELQKEIGEAVQCYVKRGSRLCAVGLLGCLGTMPHEILHVPPSVSLSVAGIYLSMMIAAVAAHRRWFLQMRRRLRQRLDELPPGAQRRVLLPYGRLYTLDAHTKDVVAPLLRTLSRPAEIAPVAASELRGSEVSPARAEP